MSNLKYYFQFVLDTRFIPSKFPSYRKRGSLTCRLSEYFIVHFTLPPDRARQWPEQFNRLRNMSYLLICLHIYFKFYCDYSSLVNYLFAGHHVPTHKESLWRQSNICLLLLWLKCVAVCCLFWGSLADCI